ncbi:hypothetical protein AKO1_015509, partial [Acrasis kona]
INLYKNSSSAPGNHRENAPLSAWSDVQRGYIPTPEPYGASLNTPKTSTSIIGDEILCVHNPGSIFEGQKGSDYNYKSYLIIQDKNIKDGISQNEINQEVEKVVKHFPGDVPLVFLLVAMKVSLPNIDPNNMFHRYLLNVKRTDGTVSSVWVIVLLKEGMRKFLGSVNYDALLRSRRNETYPFQDLCREFATNNAMMPPASVSGHQQTPEQKKAYEELRTQNALLKQQLGGGASEGAVQQAKVVRVTVNDVDGDMAPVTDSRTFKELIANVGARVQFAVAKVKFEGGVIKDEDSFNTMMSEWNGKRVFVEPVK